MLKSGFKFNFNPEILPYAIGFAVAFCSATVFGFWAILTGPLSLTSLATSYSLLIPTFWGIIFDGDETSVWLYLGLVLLAASLVFINLKDKKKDVEAKAAPEAKITLKWAIFVLIALITNGACSTIQPAQTRIFGGKYEATCAQLSPDFPLGVSNSFLDSNVKISVEDGAILVMQEI